MSIEKTIERANDELEHGRAWRAKEILASSLPQFKYAKEGCLAYANVLLQMNDDLAAGMYFLLSVDEPDSKQLAAIQIYLDRFASDPYDLFVSRFPKKSLPKKLESTSAYLQQYLKKIGAPENLFEPTKLKSKVPWASTLMSFLLVSVILFALFCTALGCLQVLRYLGGFFA